jgi:hypothetical protein
MIGVAIRSFSTADAQARGRSQPQTSFRVTVSAAQTEIGFNGRDWRPTLRLIQTRTALAKNLLAQFGGFPTNLCGEGFGFFWARTSQTFLVGFGFSVIGGTKHVKLRRIGPGGNETLIVPDHSSIAKSTLRMIFSQAPQYISQEDFVRISTTIGILFSATLEVTEEQKEPLAISAQSVRDACVRRQ